VFSVYHIEIAYTRFETTDLWEQTRFCSCRNRHSSIRCSANNE